MHPWTTGLPKPTALVTCSNKMIGGWLAITMFGACHVAPRSVFFEEKDIPRRNSWHVIPRKGLRLAVSGNSSMAVTQCLEKTSCIHTNSIHIHVDKHFYAKGRYHFKGSSQATGSLVSSSAGATWGWHDAMAITIGPYKMGPRNFISWWFDWSTSHPYMAMSQY